MPDIPFPRGVRDLMPNEAYFRNELLKRTEEIFQNMGFLTIDTPTFESLKILQAKNVIGEDVKLIYEMKFEDLALRYDHTVSLARYVSMHADLPLPFRRYYIGKCWRREEPQRLRYREFTQADIDVVGGRTAAANAEAIASCAMVLDALGLDYKIHINSRKVTEGVLTSLGIKTDLFVQVMRIIDKMDKIGRDAVIEGLAKLGLSREIITKLDSTLNLEGTNEEKVLYLEKILADKTAMDEIKETLELLKFYSLKGEPVINIVLMRGFDYYTGIVFEYKMNDPKIKTSVGGGGRYDNLIGVYSGKQIPAVGASLGIDRILDVLNFSASTKHIYANVFVANIKDSNYVYALRVANALRSSGIAVDLNVANRNISNQLTYANSLKFEYAVIVGDEEEKLNTVKLRNLVNGNEEALPLAQAIEKIKKG